MDLYEYEKQMFVVELYVELFMKDEFLNFIIFLLFEVYLIFDHYLI